MKLSKAVKILEDRMGKVTTKLPEHDRKTFFWLRLPVTRHQSTKVHSLEGGIRKLCQRYEKHHGVRVQVKSKVQGVVDSKNHCYNVNVKIYFKEDSKK